MNTKCWSLVTEAVRQIEEQDPRQIVEVQMHPGTWESYEQYLDQFASDKLPGVDWFHPAAICTSEGIERTKILIILEDGASYTVDARDRDTILEAETICEGEEA